MAPPENSALTLGVVAAARSHASLARELHPKGIHVAHVIIDGPIDGPRARSMSPGRAPHTTLDPDAIADVYWQLHRQPATAWTQEMDLRPAVEKC